MLMKLNFSYAVDFTIIKIFLSSKQTVEGFHEGGSTKKLYTEPRKK